MSKRSILIFVVLIALVIVCAVSLTACGAIKGIMDLANDIENLKSDTMKTQQEIQEALGEKYYIKYEVTSESSGEENTSETNEIIVATNGTYSFSQTGDSKVLLKKVEDVYYIYGQESGKDEYISINLYDSTINPLNSANVYMVAAGESISYSSKSDVTFLGRSCTKYSTSLGTNSSLGSVNMETEYIIDKSTGACLKYSASASADTTDGNGSGKATFEAKEFKLGNDVDAEIAVETNKIVVKEWDTEFMTSMGLTGIAPIANTQLNGASLYTSEQNKEYDIILNMDGTIEENKTALLAIAESFFNAGAKYDSGEELQASYQDLTRDESADENAPSINFDAYSEDGDEVYISIYESASDDDTIYTRISFTFTHQLAH